MTIAGSAGGSVAPLVDVAGVVAHEVPAPGEAGGEGVRQVAVGGEGARGEGQGGAGELWLAFTFLLAFPQIPGKDRTARSRSIETVTGFEDPEAIIWSGWSRGITYYFYCYCHCYCYCT